MDDNFPFIGVSDDYVIDIKPELPPLEELAWDFNKDDYIIDDSTGEFKIVKGKEALMVWIYMAIKTTRYEHEIYSWGYGTSLIDLIGQKFTKGLTESEAFRYVKEALLVSPYILDVRNNGVKFNGDTVEISIIVESVYGEVSVNVRE